LKDVELVLFSKAGRKIRKKERCEVVIHDVLVMPRTMASLPYCVPASASPRHRHRRFKDNEEKMMKQKPIFRYQNN